MFIWFQLVDRKRHGGLAADTFSIWANAECAQVGRSSFPSERCDQAAGSTLLHKKRKGEGYYDCGKRFHNSMAALVIGLTARQRPNSSQLKPEIALGSARIENDTIEPARLADRVRHFHPASRRLEERDRELEMKSGSIGRPI